MAAEPERERAEPEAPAPDPPSAPPPEPAPAPRPPTEPFLRRSRKAIGEVADAVASSLTRATRASLGYLAPYVVASIGAGLGVWCWRHPTRINELFANKESFEEQIQILEDSVQALAVFVVATLIAIGLHRILKKRFDSVGVMSRAGAWMMLFAAVPPVVACFVPGIETSHPILALFFAALASGAIGIAFYRGIAGRTRPSAAEEREGAPSAARERLARTVVVLCLFALWAAYGVLFTRIAVMNLHGMQSRTIDLGIYDNIFYQSSHGKPLGCTFIKSEYHGSAHFDPILVILSPLYLLYPRAEMLLCLQSVWLGSAIVPAYLIARNAGLGRFASLALATTYLLHPALHGANLYEFHSLTLAQVPILWVFYTFESGKLRLYLVALAVCLLTREDMALFMIFFSISAMLRHGGRARRVALATFFICVFYFAVVKWKFMVSHDIFNDGVPNEAYGFGYYYDELAHGKGLGGFILSFFTNPVFVVSLVFQEVKLVFLATMMLPFLFLPFASQRGRLVLAYGLLFSLLATRPYVFTTHFQYTAPILPVLFALTPDVLVRVRESAWVASIGLSPRRLSTALLAGLFTSTMFVTIKFGGIFDNQSFRGGFIHVVRQLTPDDVATYAWVEDMKRLIPPDAAVGVTDKMGPHVSNRKRAYFYGQTQKPLQYVFVDEAELTGNQKVYAAMKQQADAGTLVTLGRHNSMVLYKVVEPEAPAPPP